MPTQFLEPIVPSYWIQIGGALFTVFSYLMWYFLIEPRLADKYGPKAWQYVLATIGYSILTIFLYYYFVMPMLTHFLATTGG